MTTAPSIGAQPKGKFWHSHSAEEVLAQLDSAATGLSTQEAARRLATNGPNELKEGKRIGSLHIFLGQFKSVIIWILIVAGVISGLLGGRFLKTSFMPLTDCLLLLAWAGDFRNGEGCA